MNSLAAQQNTVDTRDGPTFQPADPSREWVARADVPLADFQNRPMWAIVRMNVSPQARILLLYYLLSTMKGGPAAQSIRGMAEELNIPRASLQRAKAELVLESLIEHGARGMNRNQPDQIIVRASVLMKEVSQIETPSKRGVPNRATSHESTRRDYLLKNNLTYLEKNSRRERGPAQSQGPLEATHDDLESIFERASEGRFSGPTGSEAPGTDAGPTQSIEELFGLRDDTPVRPIPRAEAPSGPAFKLRPPPAPKAQTRTKRDVASIRDHDNNDPLIPNWAWPKMYELCYAYKTLEQQRALLPSQRGRMAAVVKVMALQGADFNRIGDFRIWWRSDPWRAKNKPRPRPEEVVEHWWAAMEEIDAGRVETESTSEKTKRVNEEFAAFEAGLRARNGGAR